MANLMVSVLNRAWWGCSCEGDMCIEVSEDNTRYRKICLNGA